MPELPEAETIVRGLRPAVEDRTIDRVRVLHADVLPRGPEAFVAAAEGRTVSGVDRRGKNVVLALDDGSVVLVNLGMTGKLLPDPPESGPARATHPAVVFHFDPGGRLVYDDVRRFGRLEALAPEEWSERSRALGPEPLDPSFGPEDLWGRLRESRSPVRNLLLDQSRLAGVGNIYASEALHRARIHPRRTGRSLTGDEARELHRALRELLADAIRAGGTTIRDYRDASGEAGRYSERLRVYDRAGEACRRCGSPVERIVFTNRSAFLCPVCQPSPAEA